MLGDLRLALRDSWGGGGGSGGWLSRSVVGRALLGGREADVDPLAEGRDSGGRDELAIAIERGGGKVGYRADDQRPFPFVPGKRRGVLEECRERRAAEYQLFEEGGEDGRTCVPGAGRFSRGRRRGG